MLTEGGLRSSGILRESKTDLPLISVLTVVFNAAETLERTISSVLEQDYPNIEYIIIDGRSTDNTLKIINHHAAKIDYFISEPDNGIYDAMNKGLKLCKGDIIGILNADDWYQPETINKVARAHLKNKDSVQYGILNLHDHDGKKGVWSSYASRLPQHMIPHPTCFVPTSLYKKHGGFNLKYKIAADYDLMVRFYTKGVKFNFIENILANFTMGGACQSNDALSTQEVIKIRFENGIISEKRYRKALFKLKVSTLILRFKELLHTIYSKL